MVTHDIWADIYPGAVRPRINLSKNDTDFQINVHLYASRGEFTIGNGTTAVFRGTLPNGTVYEAPADLDIDDGVVAVTGDAGMTAFAGKAVFEVCLLCNGEALHTKNIDIRIETKA